MNKPPDELIGNWSAELEGAETWRGLSRAAIAIIMRRSKGCAIYYGLRAFSDTLDTKPFLRIQVEGLAQALGIQPPGGDR